MMDELISMEDSGSESLIPLSPTQTSDRLLEEFGITENGDADYNAAGEFHLPLDDHDHDHHAHGRDVEADNRPIIEAAEHHPPTEGFSDPAHSIDASEEQLINSETQTIAGTGSTANSRSTPSIGSNGGDKGVTAKSLKSINGTSTSEGAAGGGSSGKKGSPSVKTPTKTTTTTSLKPASASPSARPASPTQRSFLRSSSSAAAARRASLGGHETSRTTTTSGNGNGSGATILTPTSKTSPGSSSTIMSSLGTRKRTSLTTSGMSEKSNGESHSGPFSRSSPIASSSPSTSTTPGSASTKTPSTSSGRVTKATESRRASLGGVSSLSSRPVVSRTELKHWGATSPGVKNSSAAATSSSFSSSPSVKQTASPSLLSTSTASGSGTTPFSGSSTRVKSSAKSASSPISDHQKRSTPSPSRRSSGIGIGGVGSATKSGSLKSSSSPSVTKSPKLTSSPSSVTKTGLKSPATTNGSNSATKSRLSPSMPFGTGRRGSLDLGSSRSSPSNGDKGSGGKNHSPVIADRGPSMLTRRKSISSTEIRDPRLLLLPTVDVKAGDDVRLDMRGQKLRTLDSKPVNLSPKLEFVYLRDNKLASLEGIEILKRLKVLDLSFNEFKATEGAGFDGLANCKSLQQLYLAGNQITSLAGLPSLPNLEFLSVAQNKIKSLEMPTQPRLQVLAASKNKISVLKGFPYLPALENLRLEENPILDVPHVEAAFMLLVGPTLKKFNDRDLSLEEQELSLLYPASTPLCLQKGWELCGPEEAAESTLEFLSAEWSDKLPPGYKVRKAHINHPREEDPCVCEFVFEKVDNAFEDTEMSMSYQWFVGGKIPMDFVPIECAVGKEYWPRREDVGNCLKVECTIMLGETEYPPVFAVSVPVSPGSGIPRVLGLNVEGEPLEGNVIKGSASVAWCGGTPSEGLAKWLRNDEENGPVEIDGANKIEYRPTLDDVNATLTLVYTPVTQEGMKGKPQQTTTVAVKAGPPSVNDVQIVGDAVEGTVLTGYGRYFGGVEGLSKFEWLREDLESGQFKLVSRGSVDYTVGPDDVGLRLMFIYTPVNCEGVHGDPVSAISTKVQLAPPMVHDLRIVGELIEGNKTAVTSNFSGGVEGPSRVQWFKTNTRDEVSEDGDMEAISNSKVAKTFRIPLGAVGCYLVAKYTPVRSDGESGIPGYLVSDTTVQMLPPSLNFLNITGEYVEGRVLSAQYGYVGGYEGSSQYNWYLHQNESDIGTIIPTAMGRLEYEITRQAVNKFVSFRCTPVRDDGTVGESKTVFGSERIGSGPPRLTSIQIEGSAIEGEELFVEKEYWGGEEGDSRLQWYLTRPDGTQREIKGATDLAYVVRPEDIGGLLCVSCEPMRSDGVRGPLAISPVVGPVTPALPTCEALDITGPLVEGGALTFNVVYKGGEKGPCKHQWYRQYTDGRDLKALGSAEYLGLTSEDVGSRIRLVFTPVRKDGLAGETLAVVSDIVVDAEPEGRHLFVPDCFEDVEVVPQREYFGGKEGPGEFSWFQANSKPEGAYLPKDARFLYHGLVYTPALGDVGKYLVLRWIPVRSDGRRGTPWVACSRMPVTPANPAVYNVHLKEVSHGVFVGEGEYYGGYEGHSKMSWFRQTAEGYQILISGATSKTYVVTDDDYTAQIVFGYTPVRSDGVVGELALSETSGVIYPELPRIQKLVISGKAIEGEILTALEVIPKGDSQQKSWDKFKKEIKYSWSRSLYEHGDAEDFETIALQRACTYKVRLEDVGYCMRCECIISDIFGRVAEPVSCVTPPVGPGLPRIDKLEVEGRGYHTSLYAVRGIYFGGKEGKSTLQWFRAMAGSPDLIPINGETGRMYEANVDDVGYRLVAVYTPFRDDGVQGAPTSASTEPIQVEPEVAREVKMKLEVGKVKFEALRDRDRSPMKAQQQQGLGSLERRVLNVNNQRVKVVKPASKTSFSSTEIRGTYAPPFHVEIFRNDQHRVKIVIDTENEVDLMVQSRHIRDVVVLVVRGLAQRYNSTPLNLLLKM
ncbi:unnamed protein product [Calypogeia fissa]